MNAQEAVRQQLSFWHGIGGQIMSDCGDALNKRLGDAKVGSISSIYAHAVFAEDGIVLRRIRVVEGQLTLDVPHGPLTLRRLDLALQARERLAGTGFVLSGRAGVGPEGHVAVEGALSRDLRSAEGALRAGGVKAGSCTVSDATVPLPEQPTLESLVAALAATCATPL